MKYLLPLLILTNCLIIQGVLEWMVVGKVTEYGQNVTLFCNVSNCCPKDSGWDMWIPQQRTLFIDLKTGTPNKKYDGKVLKDGYTLIIQNLTEKDLNVSYSCLYDVTYGKIKFLLEEDVFISVSTAPPDAPIGNSKLSQGEIASIITGITIIMVIVLVLILVYFWIRKNKKQDTDKPDKESPEVIPFVEKDAHSDHKEVIRKIKIEQEEVIPKDIRDQMEKVIKDWENKDKMFVTTRASENVFECLQTKSCLTLTAPSGVGKSFIARHTALVLQKQGYKIIPVIKPDDIKHYYQPGKQTVFIVDDVCGNFTASQQQIENWQQLLPVINTVIADECCKVIVCCRLQIYKDDKFNVLTPFKSCECNLMSDKLCLTAEEKNKMASIYIGSRLDNIDKLSHDSEFFPLLCSLFDREKHNDVKEFFESPFMVYHNELDSLSRHGIDGNRKICSLALIVLFNNQLTEKWFQGKVTGEQRYIIEDICKACMMGITSKSELKKALLTLDGTFLHKQSGIYRTVHNTLFDFLANYIGQKMIQCLIDHGDSDLVHERFMWRKSTDDKNSYIDFIIQIPEEYLKLYLERFIKDWSAGKVRVTFGNNNMTVSLFRKHLLDHLKQLDKSQQVLLANSQDRVLPKEHHGSGSTPLIGSCYNDYTDMVQWILHNGVDVDQCRVDGFTGLLFASQEGHTEIVRLLLEKKPNINQCDKTGSSALYRASMGGKTDTVKLLLENNPNVDLCNNDDCSPLRQASLNGHTKIVKLLLAKNPNVDLCDKIYGCSPLVMASKNGHIKIVKLLLENNPDINLCDNSGCSPLHNASQEGHTEIVNLLLEKNANVNLCDKNGKSPLNMACQKQQTKIVKLLLEKNPSIDLSDNSGRSPLYTASQEGHIEIVKLLLEETPEIDLCQNNGCSPLYIASQNGHTIIVQLLLERNPNVNQCANNGLSPLDIANQQGHKYIVELLSKKNSNINLCENAHF